MKILYITTVNLTVNAFLIPHIKELIKIGNEVNVAANMCYDIPDEAKDIKYYHINFSRNPLSLSNIKAKKEIKNLVDKEKYDMIHVHTPVAAFITRLALRNEKVKVVYTAHGFHFYNGASPLNWLVYYNLEKIASKWTDKLITINNEDFERAKEKFSNSRCTVSKINGIGIDLNSYRNEKKDLKFKEELGLEKEDFILTIVAEMIKRKNHKQLIDAIELIENRKNIKVLFVGNGKLENELKAYVKSKKLTKNIKFLGYRNDVARILRITDTMCLFSHHEGLPRNLMEGMAQGKSLICTNIRGNNDLVKERENGFLVEVDDNKAVAEKIVELYKNTELQSRFSEKNLIEVEKYKIETVLEQMKEIYKSI